ncbi:MAG: glycosyltransferase [Salinivirgaceae bacterium]|nr:glycosyltransferase [Salinivirgaceae bacterium]
MKILVFTHKSSFFGASKSIFEITNVLCSEHEITYVIPNHGKMEVELQNAHYKYLILPNPIWTITPKPKKYSNWNYSKHYIKTKLTFLISFLYAYKQSINTVRRLNPDIIITNTSVAPMGLIVAKHLGIQSILWIREPLCNKTGWQIPTIFTIRQVANVISKANIVIAPSKYLKDYYENTFKLSNVYVLPNIINFFPKKINEPPKYTFGMVGSITERKGQYEFAKAMLENTTKTSLIIWGEEGTEYSRKVVNLAKMSNGRIIMGGYETNLDRIYSSFHIYVNMGINETFGRTTIEAMRAGRLVFGRNSGATPELIQHGITGFLFNTPETIFNILGDMESFFENDKYNDIKVNALKFSMNYLPQTIKENVSSLF